MFVPVPWEEQPLFKGSTHREEIWDIEIAAHNFVHPTIARMLFRSDVRLLGFGLKSRSGSPTFSALASLLSVTAVVVDAAASTSGIFLHWSLGSRILGFEQDRVAGFLVTKQAENQKTPTPT